MITAYVTLCLIWGAFLVIYNWRDTKLMNLMEEDFLFWFHIILVFVLGAILMPISVWKNIPFIIEDFKKGE